MAYPGDRNQLVNIDETNSDSAVVTCGVLQESIFGPFIFLRYGNDTVISIDPDCRLLRGRDQK